MKAGKLTLGSPISYRIEFPFQKRSQVAVPLPWALFAKGVVMQMDVPKSAATDVEPPFFMVINKGYENRFTPEELAKLPIYR